jgi:hypothetical protein
MSPLSPLARCIVTAVSPLKSGSGDMEVTIMDLLNPFVHRLYDAVTAVTARSGPTPSIGDLQIVRLGEKS